MAQRLDIKKEIERLDPEKDCQRILFLTGFMEFPWDIVRALELALFRTYAVPSIAKLLHRTGEFSKDTQRRYDDTAIVINEIMVNGYDSERGKQFIQRMNRIHGQYDISNDDFLYTLSTFVFQPIYWVNKFGWRSLYENEKLAFYYFWREVGKRMRIENIPETYEAFEQWSLEYEKAQFANVEATQQVANYSRDLLLSFYLPKFMWKAAEPGVYALMDDVLLDAMDYPKPNPLIRKSVEGGLKLRAKVLRLLPKRSAPKIMTLEKTKTHPNGYSVEDIGPQHLREKWKKD